MRSFPSALNKGGNQLSMIGKTTAPNVVEGSINTSSFSDTANIKSFNINLNSTLKSKLMTDVHIDISKHDSLLDSKYVKTDIENPFRMSSDVITAANRYRFIYKKPVNAFFSGELTYDEEGKPKENRHYLQFNVTPSMFNPKFMVQAIGMNENTPLLMDHKDNERYVIPKLPTIENLVTDSHKQNSQLGYGRFRRADFMYCRDLGKIANNHLIVLRKFAHPVGDNIFALSTKQYENPNNPGYNDFSAEGDIGRLITWFGNEENKLEDILHYEYGASWKHVDAARQWIQSKEDSEARGLTGLIGNTFYSSKTYQRMMIEGYAGKHTFFSKFGMKIVESDNADVDFHDYDNHKVYEPANTIRETHIYDGKLSFTQDIQLVFSYKLRAYDNINPKAAFLDLLGNIMEVTYKRGRFWGGQVLWAGPPGNLNGSANASWAQAAGKLQVFKDAMQHIANGEGEQAKELMNKLYTDFGELLGDITNQIVPLGKDIFTSAFSGLWDLIKGIVNGSPTNSKLEEAYETGSNASGNSGSNQNNSGGNNNSNGGGGVGETVTNLAKATGDVVVDVLAKMMAKAKELGGDSAAAAFMTFFENQLGRPAKYAYDSILTGQNVGLWHLTIGNPYNPIMAFGNLILENASVQHLGPLGIDDFPTELRVTVKLKHARPRDLNEIERMYTKGVSSIYASPAGNAYNDYFSVLSAYENAIKSKSYNDDVERITAELMQKDFNDLTSRNEFTGTFDEYAEKNPREKFIEQAKQQVESRAEFINSLWGADANINDELITSRSALIAETTGDPRNSSFISSIEEIS